MGRGRSSSKAKSSGVQYISSDKSLYKGESVTVERLLGVGYGDPQLVAEAKSDGKGNLTMDYASADSYREKNSKTKYAQYTIQNGITNLASDSDVKSVGINWDAVQTVSGKTYGAQKLLREKGFTWDANFKVWEKSGQTGKITTSVLNRMDRSQLESTVRRILTNGAEAQGKSASALISRFNEKSKSMSDTNLKEQIIKYAKYL